MPNNSGEDFTFPLISKVHQDTVIKLDIYLGSSIASSDLKVEIAHLDLKNGTKGCKISRLSAHSSEGGS